MSTPADWVWGTLSPEHLARAEQCVDALLANVRRFDLPQIRYAHPKGDRYQKTLGTQGEIAFRILTGRSLPTVAEFVSTWKGADVDRHAIKTTSRTTGDLLFDDSDLRPADYLVLVLNACPRFAIIGRIDTVQARRQRQWGVRLPRPCWLIPQHALQPWPCRPLPQRRTP